MNKIRIRLSSGILIGKNDLRRNVLIPKRYWIFASLRRVSTSFERSHLLSFFSNEDQTKEETTRQGSVGKVSIVINGIRRLDRFEGSGVLQLCRSSLSSATHPTHQHFLARVSRE